MWIFKKEYDNAIKIAFYTENQIPDFNKSDYAIGFDNINYLDRYFRKTTLIWIFEKRYLNIKYKDFTQNRINSLNSKINKKFCGAVITNYLSSDKFRIKFINELNKYKKVDMGGRFMNNIGEPVKNKTEFLSLYKFSIAMENSEGQGYVSEKILDSLIAGTIPIYYGGYMIDEFINPKAYILIRNENDIKQKIEYIKKIDNDDNLYKKILNESLFIDDNIPSLVKKEKINFFNHIFQQKKIKQKEKIIIISIINIFEKLRGASTLPCPLFFILSIHTSSGHVKNKVHKTLTSLPNTSKKNFRFSSFLGNPSHKKAL